MIHQVAALMSNFASYQTTLVLVYLFFIAIEGLLTSTAGELQRRLISQLGMCKICEGI